MMKRAVDVCGAVLGLVLFAPVMLVVSVVVRVTMGSPVIFRQTRSGRLGVPFTVYKFRTMRDAGPGEDGPDHDHRRITRVGRFLRSTSLDELPSLVNVVKGEMSLVGPRPLPIRYATRFTTEQARRLEVRPGVTGWAIVHGRNSLPWEERLALDVWYVDHHSLALDVKVLWRSLVLVFRRTGVDHADGVTMTEFTGS